MLSSTYWGLISRPRSVNRKKYTAPARKATRTARFNKVLSLRACMEASSLLKKVSGTLCFEVALFQNSRVGLQCCNILHGHFRNGERGSPPRRNCCPGQKAGKIHVRGQDSQESPYPDGRLT